MLEDVVFFSSSFLDNNQQKTEGLGLYCIADVRRTSNFTCQSQQKKQSKKKQHWKRFRLKSIFGQPACMHACRQTADRGQGVQTGVRCVHCEVDVHLLFPARSAPYSSTERLVREKQQAGTPKKGYSQKPSRLV